jgi:lipopolysaccharide/colanic/teichoic acid biosynthesis glycosyltransferase
MEQYVAVSTGELVPSELVVPMPVATPYVRFVKPVIDRVLGAVLLLLALPIIVAVAFAVRVSLGTGVVFTQERMGCGGVPFRIYKFRTMRPSRRREHRAFEGDDRRQTHKHPNDPRMSKVGRLLRRMSLDELPQLFNVVKGDMSLVGPRPEIVDIVQRYEPWQHRRHCVKPGLTGLWQVSARERPMHQATDIDLEYVDAISFLTDLRILVRTIPAALGRKKGW